ncbi:translation initiation factor eIF2B subunit beta [Saccharomycopsis crataegensis]|uniref:Translation initiation factor eIF2B subunit beta n=1 Tax=Saccharomycopsis crataegensis TaxID=43959 RepID=A0AAV5QEK4_9ASCO|nr:translation initiation factor eIF2B subunit beta [Saccharomycopsis crataegensis]
MSAINAAKDKDLHILMDTFISKLKRKQIHGSYNVAIETAQLLVKVVSLTKWTSLEQLISSISLIGKRLVDAQPRAYTCGNVVRRVLALIRDELEDEEKTKGSTTESSNVGSSMFNLLTPAKTDAQNKNKSGINDQRAVIIQSIRDLVDEIRNVDQEIEGMLDDLVHDNETLLTPTPSSQTVLRFLKRARQKRKFKVMVTECFPNDTAVAHNFAKQLAEANIETIIVPDTSVFAVMAGVSKVIVGTRCVFANGGSVTESGVSTVVECAREHRTPVFAVTGLYKLSPCYPFNRESLIEFGNSGKVVKFQENTLVENAETANPLYDYVPPENIDIFITNVGGISPNFIYRIVLDNYKQEDIDL